MEDKYFQHFLLPQKAKSLAQRTLNALLPMIQQPTLPLVSAAEARRTWQSEYDHLLRVFQLALDIRCKVLTSKDLFEMNFHSPGIKFEADKMELEQESHSSGDSSVVPKHSVVRLTILPGIRRFEHDKKRVDYSGFIRREEFMRMSPDWWTKAAVLLKPST